MFIDKNLANALAKQNSKLLNSGTSEGVKKAWESRRDAGWASDRAKTFTENAITQDGHKAAAIAHGTAKFAHEQAAKDAASIGDTNAEQMHKISADYHDKM